MLGGSGEDKVAALGCDCRRNVAGNSSTRYGYAAAVDPEDEMISGGYPGPLREFHMGDGSKDPTRPYLGGKSRGELVSQERPDRPRVALEPRRLNGHHDRC